MKKQNKPQLFNSHIKRFIWAFLSINLLGIGTNAILYFLKMPNRIETMLDADIFFITLAIMCYIIFNIMLYFIIKIHFIIEQRKE
ncbi:TPA: hypothetical protein RPV63_001723 [Campylobacter fetus subsp. venerealis]|uniref:hypothetical protein n=1 Tax=Campylobacter hyointestinalis TaxID=198 RepID=UPI00164D18C3|nr:hypothetical protein [Campylobacter hyointestinalis]HDX6248472.1 hypothetical protein [Campylobacter fetus subsp. venerealis]HDX6258180.1 hypothetical protein [Campylobacter fetus subsp. venerealis]HDX6261986.1 hypothetical protein [Campylobacter fetus subsp. venerealis]HDX6264423.1 hypothetical protein [Campylobacter fetus subsp. venerealis]HDX6266344.1 hypothetical protein [Campylobacter fetus subsp. venerealis]